MIQPYQLSLLRALSQGSPFRDLVMPTSFQLTVIKPMPTIKVTAANLQASTRDLVAEAIEALQKRSIALSDAPTPNDVKHEIERVAHHVGQDLAEEVHEARVGCKRLNDTVLRQRDIISSLEADKANLETALSGTSKALTETKAQLRAAQQNARGNVVLLRRDGFSKPMQISPVFTPFGPPEFPREVVFHDMPESSFEPRHYEDGFSKIAYRTLRFHQTSRKDGFGRVIFEEI